MTTAVNPALAMALIIAMSGPLADGLLWRLIDPFSLVAPPGVAHACPPSDPCAGSDGGGAWEAIGFIAAAGRACRGHRRRSSSYFGFIFLVELRRNKY